MNTQDVFGRRAVMARLRCVPSLAPGTARRLDPDGPIWWGRKGEAILANKLARTSSPGVGAGVRGPRHEGRRDPRGGTGAAGDRPGRDAEVYDPFSRKVHDITRLAEARRLRRWSPPDVPIRADASWGHPGAFP